MKKKFIYVERDDELLIDDDRFEFDRARFRSFMRCARASVTAKRVIELPSRNDNRHVIVLLSRPIPSLLRCALRAPWDDPFRVAFDVANELLGSRSLLITADDWTEFWRNPDYPYSAAKIRELRKWTYKQ